MTMSAFFLFELQDEASFVYAAFSINEYFAAAAAARGMHAARELSLTAAKWPPRHFADERRRHFAAPT